MSKPPFNIRRCEARDCDAVYEVCLKTGNAGKDATALYSDPKALGHIFVGPYMHLEPRLAFVLEDALGVCGYVLGALDSASYYKRFLEEWLPEIRRRYSEPKGDPTLWSPTEKICHQCHHPEVYYPATFREYPSHMHIDLVARAQGHGQGKRMVQHLIDALKDCGSPGVHLGMDVRNARAERFYRRLGFVELSRLGAPDPKVVYYAKKL